MTKRIGIAGGAVLILSVVLWLLSASDGGENETMAIGESSRLVVAPGRADTAVDERNATRAIDVGNTERRQVPSIVGAGRPNSASQESATDQLGLLRSQLANLPQAHPRATILKQIVDRMEEQVDFLTETGLGVEDAERIVNEAYDAIQRCAETAFSLELDPKREGDYVSTCSTSVWQEAGLSGFVFSGGEEL
jgi:hypothetical protein